MRVFLIGSAGFAGAVSRDLLGGWIARRTSGAFPWHTFVVNASGCFALGVLVTVFTDRLVPNPDVRAALTVGFLGAYTTFSTFAYESFELAEDGATNLALTNIVASVAVGIVAAWLGTVVGRAF